MATSLTSSTFLSTYNDDFTDSDHYHRILFNSGRALQARELTQSQTIIQRELERLAGFILTPGGMFATSPGAIFSGADAVGFVKISSALPVGYAGIVGTEVSNAAGVTAIVKAIVDATGADPVTLLVAYQSSNNLQSASTNLGPRIFQATETISYDTGTISGTLTVQTNDTAANPATGKGSIVEVPQFNTFAAGHIIMVEAQSLVVSKYSDVPNATIGFKLVEQIITTADDIALYDNAGATPNLTSPGADRYKITMTLIDKANITATDTFFPLYEIKKGVARQIVNSDNVLSELGDILAARTDNITGNFIVRNNQLGEFGIEIATDSDNGFYQLKVDGGVAFVKGRRIEKSNKTIQRVQKPRRDPQDLDIKTNEFIAATYGSYFLADSAYGLTGKITNFTQLNLKNGRNLGAGATTIGTARIRSLDHNGGLYRIHVFDVDMDSNGSGTEYSIGNVRSIGTDSDNYANLTIGPQGTYDLYDKEQSSLLFPLPKDRVNEISTVTARIGRVYTDVTSAGGEGVYTTGSSNTFANTEDFIVSIDSSGKLFPTPTFSGTPTTSATITGLPNNSASTLYGFENKSLVLKTKTLNTNQTASGISVVNSKFTIPYADIYKFNSVTDATTSEDITYKFDFDNGQRDNFYTIGSGRLRSGFSAPAGTITVNFDYFSHSAGDYFGGKPSYPDITYENVPYHTTSFGVSYKLTDVIDMRPVMNNTGTGFTGTGAIVEDIPKNTDTITIGTAKYWQPRQDTVTIGPDGSINVYQGPTNNRPTASDNVPSVDLKLANIVLNPYMVDNKDVDVRPYENLGYKMKDIDALRKRIENVEEVVSATQAELRDLNLTIPDPNSSTLPDRTKNGITADAFNSNIQADVYNPDYRATIHKNNRILRPVRFLHQSRLIYDSDLSSGTVIKENMVFPKYDEEVMINQNVASKSINVNQYVTTKTRGAAILRPNLDTWTLRKKVDESYQAGSQESYLPIGSNSTSSQGEQTS